MRTVPAFRPTSHEITIESASTEKKIVLVNAEIGNLHFQLTCFLNLTRLPYSEAREISCVPGHR